jgi:O-antigen/teichoic acid export membrane protein
LTDHLARRAGTAVVWRATQLFGVQVIFLARLLILARLLSPDDFGLLAIALTVVGFLLAVTDFGMVAALVHRVDSDQRHYDVAWTVGMGRALAVSAVMFATAPLAAGLFDEPRAIDIVRVLAVMPLLDASASIRLADLTRSLEFRSLAVVGIGQALANTVIAIALAPTLGVWALVAGVIAGSAAHSALSYLLAPHRPRLLLDRIALEPLVRFGRWIFVTGLVAQLGSVTLRAVISRELGTAELGLFFLASSLAFLPAQVASEVAGSVAFPLYVRLQTHVRQAARAFQALLSGLAMLLIPASALLIVLAPAVVDNLLDARWAGAAPTIQVLALAGLIGLFGETTVPLLKGFGKPERVAVLEVVQTLLIVLAVLWLARSYGLIGAALALLLAISASQGVSAWYVRRMLPRPFSGIGAPMLFIAAAALLGAAVAWLIDTRVQGITGLLLAAAAGTLLTGALLWAGGRRLPLGLFADLVLAFPQLAFLIPAAPGRRR